MKIKGKFRCQNCGSKEVVVQVHYVEFTIFLTIKKCKCGHSPLEVSAITMLARQEESNEQGYLREDFTFVLDQREVFQFPGIEEVHVVYCETCEKLPLENIPYTFGTLKMFDPVELWVSCYDCESPLKFVYDDNDLGCDPYFFGRILPPCNAAPSKHIDGYQSKKQAFPLEEIFSQESPLFFYPEDDGGFASSLVDIFRTYMVCNTIYVAIPSPSIRPKLHKVWKSCDSDG